MELKCFRPLRFISFFLLAERASEASRRIRCRTISCPRGISSALLCNGRRATATRQKKNKKRSGPRAAFSRRPSCSGLWRVRLLKTAALQRTRTHYKKEFRGRIIIYSQSTRKSFQESSCFSLSPIPE